MPQDLKSIFIGIDQTGAVNSKGVPRPLPARLLQGSNFDFFAMNSFSQREIFAQEAELILDCVIGLPCGLNLQWRDALKLLTNERAYGRQAAEKFFEQLGGGDIWHREVEIQAQANSVFRSRPFQKNIQTGTFRFWVDMAKDPDWFQAPWLPGEHEDSAYRIYEGYPSLLWRKLFSSQHRNPEQIRRWTEKRYGLKWTQSKSDLVLKDPNFADALVLALGGREFLKRSHPVLQSEEGWILGVR